MEKRELTCIGCPLGCAVTVTLEDGAIRDISGYTCKRGYDYAEKEVTHPARTVTTTVRLCGGSGGARVVSCKTETDVPKEKIFDVIRALKPLRVQAPVRIGDVLLENAAGTGVRIVATQNVR